MELDTLNSDTLKGYRIVFEQLHEGHPWNKLMWEKDYDIQSRDYSDYKGRISRWRKQ